MAKVGVRTQLAASGGSKSKVKAAKVSSSTARFPAASVRATTMGWVPLVLVDAEGRIVGFYTATEHDIAELKKAVAKLPTG